MRIVHPSKQETRGYRHARFKHPVSRQTGALRWLTLGVLLASFQLLAGESPQPPRTRIEVVIDRMHGIDIPDPYRVKEIIQNIDVDAIEWYILKIN